MARVIQSIFEEYYQKKSQIEITIDQMKNDLNDMIDKIVLYGAGSAGIAFLHYLWDAEIYPVCFADGNPKRWGEICESLPIINYADITTKVGNDALVIITINTDGKNYCKSFSLALRQGGPHAVFKKLYESGCKNVIEYTAFRHCFQLFKGDCYNLPSCSDISEMEKNYQNICKVYSLMADAISKETYEKILKFRLLDDTITIPTFDQKQEYFDYNIYKKIPDEIFVDCGAYTGTTLEIFLENNNMFEKYYALEPDKDNFEGLQEKCRSQYREMENSLKLYNAAAYDISNISLPFYSLKSPGSFVCEQGKDTVRTISIDDMLAGKKVTFIKMNIEGCEIKALKGAEETIRKYNPVLAIMGYHKTVDFWEIPILIKKMFSGYKIYIRSYMNHISFMYYAIPEERRV